MKDETPDKLQNASTGYKGQRITFFNSFEEMEEDTLRYRAALTPEEHLEMVTRLLEQFFADEIKQAQKIKRITFDY